MIAVATDFSTRSDRALARASLIAKRYGADLLLIHVVDDDQPSSVIDAHRFEADKLLASLNQSLVDLTGVNSRSETVLGDPFERITTVAADKGARLLVMGPHRRQLLRDQFRGTTVERSIRRSRIPVLVANAVPAGDYTNVLLATDLSAQSAQALKKAVSLRFLKDSEHLLVHIFEPLAKYSLGRAPVSTAEIEDYVASERAEAASQLREFSEASRLGAIGLLAQELHRSIERDLLGLARNSGAQLIVVGSGQKRFLESVILGSVAEGILRDAECDVLVIPSSVTDQPDE